MSHEVNQLQAARAAMYYYMMGGSQLRSGRIK